jgi:hypothetical protein
MLSSEHIIRINLHVLVMLSTSRSGKNEAIVKSISVGNSSIGVADSIGKGQQKSWGLYNHINSHKLLELVGFMSCCCYKLPTIVCELAIQKNPLAIKRLHPK